MLSSVVPRIATDSAVSVSWCLKTSLFLRLPSQDGAPSLPPFLSFYLLYFSYLLSKTMGCFSGCLMSSAGIQKLFYVTYSPLKCSFDEFVGEKVVSQSYSSAILEAPPAYLFYSILFLFLSFFFFKKCNFAKDISIKTNLKLFLYYLLLA